MQQVKQKQKKKRKSKNHKHVGVRPLNFVILELRGLKISSRGNSEILLKKKKKQKLNKK